MYVKTNTLFLAVALLPSLILAQGNSTSNSTVSANSTISANSTLTTGAAAPSLSIDPGSWYAIYTLQNQFLDSQSGKIVTNVVNGGLSAVSSSDQGQRFRFPSGLGGQVVCQAHSNNVVTFDQKSNSFRADGDSSSGNSVTAQAAPGNSSQIVIYEGQYYISSSAQPDQQPDTWMIAKIDEAS